MARVKSNILILGVFCSILGSLSALSGRIHHFFHISQGAFLAILVSAMVMAFILMGLLFRKGRQETYCGPKGLPGTSGQIQN